MPFYNSKEKYYQSPTSVSVLRPIYAISYSFIILPILENEITNQNKFVVWILLFV